MNVPILYINLARSKERRQRMEAQFARERISVYSRIDAIDGRDLYASPEQLSAMVDIPANVKQTPCEIGCCLSHIRAAETVLDLGLKYALIMEDDIHLTYYKHWRVTLRDIIAMAPSDWTVLQLTVNNVRVLRTLAGLGVPFVSWRKNHWSTGAYIINRAGCKRCVREYKDGARYKLPQGVQLVSDVLMYNGAGTYTFTRPLFYHVIKESTIHQAHVESCHRQASELVACYYERFDMIWGGGDDSRAAIVTRLSELAREDQRLRLKWWIEFHLRIGFRWLFLYVNGDCKQQSIAMQFSWLGESTTFLSHPVADAATENVTNSVAMDAIARARSAGASWLLQLRDYDLFYVLPGRSLKSVFDEVRRGCVHAEYIPSLQFDIFEAQKRLCITQPSAFDSSYNFFECERLFKRRRDHVDGSPISQADDCAYYEFTPNPVQPAHLPDKHGDVKTNDAPTIASLAGTEGRSACRLAERGLVPFGSHGWRSTCRISECSTCCVVSKRAVVLTYRFCHFDAWRRAFEAQDVMSGHDDTAPRSSAHRPLDTATVSSAFDAASRLALAAAYSKHDPRIARNFYSDTVLMPLEADTSSRVSIQVEASGHPEPGQARVHLELPDGCVRTDCGGAYVRISNCHGGSALYKQQDGSHHLYRISKPFVAWMIGRTPYSSTAALVAHDLALCPQDIRAPWSAYDGRRWASIPSAYVRLEQHVTPIGTRYAVICPAAVVQNEIDTMRSLMLPPPRYNPGLYSCVSAKANLTMTSQPGHISKCECWQTRGEKGEVLGTFLTAEQAETAVRAAARCLRRSSCRSEVKDRGAIVIDLPATCGAAADACAGVYIPYLKAGGTKATSPLGGNHTALSASTIQVETLKSTSCVYQHEEGAHFLYYYAPFSAWMIGSRPGSGSAALIAYDGAEKPELILPISPWRVYDGRAWREVSGIRIRTLADTASKETSTALSIAADSSYEAREGCSQRCTLAELPIYPWTPEVDHREQDNETMWSGAAHFPSASRRQMVYTCAGDRAVIPCWFQNGQRQFDLWVTYYGHSDEDRWRAQADIYRRRKGGKFENLQALWHELADVLKTYDAIMVMDDDVIIDAPRINKLFELRRTHNLLCLQPAFETRGKISHAITAVQPGNRLRLTNFIEMTCPLFATPALLKFLDGFDPALKGWGADWWFLTVIARTAISLHKDSTKDCEATPAISLRGVCAVVDAVTCINPTDHDKGGLREINTLQGREQRRAVWEAISQREDIHEWHHLEFGSVWLTADGQPDLASTLATKWTSKPPRIRGCRSYETAPVKEL